MLFESAGCQPHGHSVSGRAGRGVDVGQVSTALRPSRECDVSPHEPSDATRALRYDG